MFTSRKLSKYICNRYINTTRRRRHVGCRIGPFALLQSLDNWYFYSAGPWPHSCAVLPCYWERLSQDYCRLSTSSSPVCHFEQAHMSVITVDSDRGRIRFLSRPATITSANILCFLVGFLIPYPCHAEHRVGQAVRVST